MTPLERRILSLTPALDYGLEAFLSVLEVRETRDVSSAAVPIGGAPRLLLNPDFVEAHCLRDTDLLVLVLHELHHVLLGHTRLYPRVTVVHNIAFDAVINAMIAIRNPDGEFGGLFRRTYAADVFPELLLRPPEGFPGEPIYSEAVLPEWRVVIENLYYTRTGTFHDVFSLLVDAIKDSAHELFLLGNHDDPDQGVTAEDPVLFEVVRRIVERWPQPPDPRIGRSLEEALSTAVFAVRRVSPVSVMRRAILAAARGGVSDRCRRRHAPQAVQTVIPTRDRRAFAVAAAGGTPLLYRSQLKGHRRPSGITPVDIYIDVSGSVHQWISAMVEAVLSVRNLVAPRLFLFSNTVVETTIAALEHGEVRTSWGTSGDVVMAHLADQNSTSAVVITDGYVGRISDGYQKTCHNARLQVVLTPDGWRRDLEAFAKDFYTLEKQ